MNHHQFLIFSNLLIQILNLLLDLKTHLTGNTIPKGIIIIPSMAVQVLVL